MIFEALSNPERSTEN